MKKTLAALAGALVALPVLAAGPQGFAAAPQFYHVIWFMA